MGDAELIVPLSVVVYVIVVDDVGNDGQKGDGNHGGDAMRRGSMRKKSDKGSSFLLCVHYCGGDLTDG